MKKPYIFALILLLCQSVVFPNPYKLSPDYRPVKISINWVGFNEEQEHTDYEYNKKGQLIKASIYRGEDSPSWYDVFEYSETNQLIKKSTYSSTGLTYYIIYSYMNNSYMNNSLYEEAEFKQDGIMNRVTYYEYDKNRNIISISIKEMPYEEKNLSWNTLEFRMYDPEKRISEKLEYYNGILENRTVYSYTKNNLNLTTYRYGDLRDVIAKTVANFTYISTGKDQGRLQELNNKSTALYEGKEETDCCTTYTMKPEYEPAGNMTKLTFYNCENERTGFALIVWEKGKTDMELIKNIFRQIHWNFTGC